MHGPLIIICFSAADCILIAYEHMSLNNGSHLLNSSLAKEWFEKAYKLIEGMQLLIVVLIIGDFTILWYNLIRSTCRAILKDIRLITLIFYTNYLHYLRH